MTPALVGSGAELQPAQNREALNLLQQAHGLVSDEDIVGLVALVGVRLKIWVVRVRVRFAKGLDGMMGMMN